MELAEEEDAFDVFGYLKKLRQSRRGLIENLVQYQLHIVKARSKILAPQLKQLHIMNTLNFKN